MPSGRRRRKSSSSNSAPTAADFSTSTPRIRSKIRRRCTGFVEMVCHSADCRRPLLHVRPDDRRHAARLGRVGRHAGDLRAAVAARLLGRTIGQPETCRARACDQAASDRQPGGNMEGKEVRFGIAQSAIWAAATTAASNGSVNSMHDSFTPLGGLVPMWLMQLGEVDLRRRRQRALRNARLRHHRRIHRRADGRTNAGISRQEDRGLRDENGRPGHFDSADGRAGRARPWPWPTDSGSEGILNKGGPHGFSEVLYAFSSAGNNNGSAFAGPEHEHAVLQYCPWQLRC